MAFTSGNDFKMGEPALHRGLNSFMSFAIGLSEVAVVVSISMTFGAGLIAGGPVLLIWGFIIAFIMSTFVAFSMAELCSAYPSAGSVYHWSGQLSPVEHASLWSYICGWANFIGNFGGDAAFAAAFAAFLSSSLAASGSDQLSDVTQVILAVSVLFIWTFLNFFRIDQVGWVNSIAAIVHIGTLFVVMILLYSMAKKLNTSEFVFTRYYNDTGFDSVFYVFLLSMVSGMFSFVGYEASSHMAEETSDESDGSPSSLGMIYTVIASGVVGFIYLVTLLFATVDIGAVLNGSDAADTGSPVINVFVYTCGELWGAVLAWLLVVNIFFAGHSSVTVTGRITYALARDKAFPFSEMIAELDPYFQSPVNALLFSMVLAALLNALPITAIGKTAFYGIVGLSTIGYQVSYGIPILLKVVYDPADFPITPMSLGVWSYPVSLISCIWLFASGFLFLLPVSYPVTADNMNWLIVTCAAAFAFGAANWHFNSRFSYQGPKRHKHQEEVGLLTSILPSVGVKDIAGLY